MAHPQTHIVGPASWASYLINGDASSLSENDREDADDWLKRERVQIIGIQRSDVTDMECEPYFTTHARLHAPELGVDGMMALDYIALELSIDEEPK